MKWACYENKNHRLLSSNFSLSSADRCCLVFAFSAPKNDIWPYENPSTASIDCKFADPVIVDKLQIVQLQIIMTCVKSKQF